MKKRIFVTFSVILIMIALVTAFTACDDEKLFDSSWEAALICNAQGDIIARGEDYAYSDDVDVATVTCAVSENGELTIRWTEGDSILKGVLTETGEGTDKSVRYSVEFSDGTAGTATYLQNKDAVYPSDTDKDDGYDLPEKYELTITLGEDYTLYFVRVSQIK